jgi:hypothetical protein
MPGLRERLGRLAGRLTAEAQRRPAASADLDDLLAERVGAHFDRGFVEAGVVHTGIRGIRVTCRVDLVTDGDLRSASLFFEIGGGPFGPDTSFASVSGYGATPEVAVVEGACRWTCMLRSLLQAAFEGTRPDELMVDREVLVQGRPYRLHAAALDRVMYFEGVPPEAEQARDVAVGRSLVGGTGWLVDRLVDGDVLPPLASSRAALISAFSSRMGDGAIREVKVRGADWAPGADAVALDGEAPGNRSVMLRELAVLVPCGDVALDRPTVERSLAAMAHLTRPHEAAGWRGWRAHGGRLGDALTPEELATVEARVGRLPDGFRRFLLDVAGPGAGPGYGLLRPTPVPDGILLALAGCGVGWVLRLDEPHRGTVWIDARGCDDTWREVAPDVATWYADWLDAAFGSQTPWTPWDARACACTKILGQAIERASAGERAAGRLEDGEATSITIRSGGGLVPQDDILDPSHACAALLDAWGIPDSAYATGPSGVA